MRGLVVTAWLFASGCNCFVPVYEGDAGQEPKDAGSGCSTAAQCTGARPAQSLCAFTSVDAGFSCIDTKCVYDCQPDRACTSNADAGCISCAGKATSCQRGPMGCGTTKVATVDTTNGCPGNLMDLTLTPIAGTCGWSIADTNTSRSVGTVYEVDDGYLVYIPELGGTCTGFALSTQVERWLLSCPACQLELRL